MLKYVGVIMFVLILISGCVKESVSETAQVQTSDNRAERKVEKELSAEEKEYRKMMKDAALTMQKQEELKPFELNALSKMEQIEVVKEIYRSWRSLSPNERKALLGDKESINYKSDESHVVSVGEEKIPVKFIIDVLNYRMGQHEKRP